jgi:hypothetical protein
MTAGNSYDQKTQTTADGSFVNIADAVCTITFGPQIINQ